MQPRPARTAAVHAEAAAPPAGCSPAIGAMPAPPAAQGPRHFSMLTKCAPLPSVRLPTARPLAAAWAMRGARDRRRRGVSVISAGTGASDAPHMVPGRASYEAAAVQPPTDECASFNAASSSLSRAEQVGWGEGGRALPQLICASKHLCGQGRPACSIITRAWLLPAWAHVLCALPAHKHPAHCAHCCNAAACHMRVAAGRMHPALRINACTRASGCKNSNQMH